MKTIIICGALFILICFRVHAVQTPKAGQEKAPVAPISYGAMQKTAATHPNPKSAQYKGIDCDVRIPGETQVDKALIGRWAEYAALHSFNFDSLLIETQLKDLKSCYTKKGWLGFINALNDSENIKAIKTQRLRVNSSLDGKVQFIEVKENQWKINVPIKVIYKNAEEEVTHFLNVYLIISWKNAFQLGIVQMVATPRSSPLSMQAITVREAVRSISLSAIEQINNAEHLQKWLGSFLASLSLTFSPQAVLAAKDKITGHREMLPGLEHDNLKQIQHLAKGHNNYQVCQEKKESALIKSTADFQKTLGIIGIKILNKLQLTKNQLSNTGTNIFSTKLPELIAYFKERSAVGFKSPLKNLDKLKLTKVQTLITQLAHKKSQIFEPKKNQWDIVFPLQVVGQNDPNQISQVDVHLTMGRNTNGDLVILKTNIVPSRAISTSNHLASGVSNVHVSSNLQQAGSNHTEDNTIKLVQALNTSDSKTVTKTVINPSSGGPETINCDYQIPEGTATIDEQLVVTWAQNAAIQSFDFNSASLEAQLDKLKSCYTEKGWENFRGALDKSGNIEAIKSQNLVMSSKVNGQTKLIGSRNNLWDIELPLKVVYRNKQSQATQYLHVNLTMKRKPAGKFGIMRINATLIDPDNPIPSAANSSNKNIDSVQKAQLDCDFKIPADISEFNQDVLLTWAKYAVTHSFSFDSDSIDVQLKKLQSCYMEQAWYAFLNSMEKSGNIKTFKTQKLRATSQIDGKIQLVESRNNIWKVSVPLKINYQYEYENIIQLLKIELTIGRKNTGEFGIIQLNSTLRVASLPESPKLLAHPGYMFG